MSEPKTTKELLDHYAKIKQRLTKPANARFDPDAYAPPVKRGLEPRRPGDGPVEKAAHEINRDIHREKVRVQRIRDKEERLRDAERKRAKRQAIADEKRAAKIRKMRDAVESFQHWKIIRSRRDVDGQAERDRPDDARSDGSSISSGDHREPSEIPEGKERGDVEHRAGDAQGEGGAGKGEYPVPDEPAAAQSSGQETQEGTKALVPDNQWLPSDHLDDMPGDQETSKK